MRTWEYVEAECLTTLSINRFMKEESKFHVGESISFSQCLRKDVMNNL